MSRARCHAIEGNRVAHAFSSRRPRVGKTTSARAPRKCLQLLGRRRTPKADRAALPKYCSLQGTRGGTTSMSRRSTGQLQRVDEVRRLQRAGVFARARPVKIYIVDEVPHALQRAWMRF